MRRQFNFLFTNVSVEAVIDSIFPLRVKNGEQAQAYADPQASGMLGARN